MPESSRAGDVNDIANAGKTITDLLKDQHITTSGTGGDNATADQIIQMLIAKSSGTGEYDTLIDNIMHRSALAFAPILGEQVSSGGYNATATKQLAGEAAGRATGEAAQVILNAQAEAAKTAANLTAQKLQVNQEKTVKAPYSMTDFLKTLGVAYGANKLMKYGSGLFSGGSNAALEGDAFDSTFGSGLEDLGGGFSFSSSAGGLAGGSGAVGQSVGATGLGLSGSDAGLISAEDLSFLSPGISDATLGNSAALASLTDASVSNSPAAFGAPYGDFGDIAAGAEGGGSDVLSTVSSATAVGGVAETGLGAVGAPAIAETAGLEFGADAVGAGSTAAGAGSGLALAGPIAAMAYGAYDVVSHPYENLGAATVGAPLGMIGILDTVGLGGVTNTAGDIGHTIVNTVNNPIKKLTKKFKF